MGSFVPPRPIRDLRDLTRYRTTLTHERVRHANRLHKVLEDAGIKLATVASDILGVSGRAMLSALVAGTTDPAVLAELARGRLRTKLPALRAALAGRFRGHHAFLVSQMLGHLDYLEEAIATVTTQIEAVLRPFAAVVARLDTIPGISRRVAEVVVAEIGTDMTAFPSARHPAGGAGLGTPRLPRRPRTGGVISEQFPICSSRLVSVGSRRAPKTNRRCTRPRCASCERRLGSSCWSLTPEKKWRPCPGNPRP